MTHICVGKLTNIGSDNGLSPGRRQAIIWTNTGILLIGPLGTNFNEILIKIPTFSCTKMYLKISCAKWRPFCLCFNVLNAGSLAMYDGRRSAVAVKANHDNNKDALYYAEMVLYFSWLLVTYSWKPPKCWMNIKVGWGYLHIYDRLYHHVLYNKD